MKNKSKYHWDEFNRATYYNRIGFYKTTVERNFVAKQLNNVTKNAKILDIGGAAAE